MPSRKQEKKVVKSGGAKGQAVVDYVAEHGPSTRSEIADAVGCTLGRVGETSRFEGWVEHDGKRWGPAVKARRSRKVAS